MMKLKHLIENYDLARYALRHYLHDAKTLDSLLSRFRISSNAVYPYLQNGQLCFLRLAPVEEKPLPHVCAELDFIRYLREQHYPAMKPIPTVDGLHAFQLDSPWGSYCVSAFEAVPGVPIEDGPLSPEIIRAYGRALGHLHSLSAACTIRFSRPCWNEALTRQLLTDAGASQALLTIYDKVSASLSALPVSAACFGLIHYDFEPDNVFWSDETRTISVIDFDDCIYGWYALDVEQALDSLCELSEKDLSADFLAGYRSVHPFPEEQEAWLPLMRKYIDLRSYVQLKHCLSEEVKNPPEWMLFLKTRLENRLAQLERSIVS